MLTVSLFTVVPSFPGADETVVNASAGQMLVFTCDTEGSPLPNITWYKDGAEIYETGNIYINETVGLQRVTSDLTIVDVTRADNGVYSCNATNFRFVLFEAMSPTTTVTVYCTF